MSHHTLSILVVTLMFTGCADTKTPDQSPPAPRPVATPEPSASQPTTAPTTQPATAPTTQPATAPATQPEEKAKSQALRPIVVSEDGLHVEGEFTHNQLLKLPWIEVLELMNPDEPGEIAAAQEPPRTLDATTRNVKRLRIDFNKTELDRSKRVIVHLDQGRGMDLGRKKSSVYVFERSSSGRWMIVEDGKKK